jgi:gluconolactonase
MLTTNFKSASFSAAALLGFVASIGVSQPPANDVKLQVVAGGYTKLDTPCWLPAEKCLLVTDLTQKKLFRLDPPAKIGVLREEACRGKVGPDGRFYGMMDSTLVSWRPGEKPAVILAKAPGDKVISLNDLAVSDRFLYFTTLKDPDKGRVTIVDLKSKTATVAFDGETETDLANPNGVALAPDGKHLYVGISSYKKKKQSGVYRFPLRADGSLDVASGKSAPWAKVAGPDGIAVRPNGEVWFTAGSSVHRYSTDGKSLGKLAIPKGSGTNLAFGGPDGNTLFVTTDQVLYSARIDSLK